MAAGRHGGYRNHEFRDRETNLDVLKRKEFSQVPFRDESRKWSRSSRDLLDVSGTRSRDLKENETAKGYFRPSPSMSNSGGRSSISGRSEDREPGELSSGSGSDDTNEPPQSKGMDNVVSEVEKGSLSPLSKKRKYSPIVWGRGDYDQSRSTHSRGKIAPLDNSALPPPPPLPQGPVHSNPIEVARSGGRSSPMDIEQAQREQNWSSGREPEQLEEEEDYYISSFNISTSRWADGNSALEHDEAEHIVKESSSKRQKKSPMNDIVPLRLQKEITPELGEVSLTDPSDGVISGLSGSGGEGEVDSQNTEDEKDSMVLEHEDIAEDSTGHRSDRDSDEGDASLTPEPIHSQRRSINMLQGCRSVHEFERLNRIGEGTYGVVFRAKDKKTGEVVALKKVKMEKERDGFPLTSLREINILLSFHHPSIVNVKEVVMDDSLDSIFMVMEYMEHDLKGLMGTMKQPFSQSEVKCLMLQLLEGVKYLHDNWVLHRDLKTSNLLLNNRGELKICDFGMSRQYGSPLKPYTSLVVTLWYRAPELLLGAKEYSTALDMWSLGCIMAEFLAKEALFGGKNEIDQLNKIFKTLGTPNETRWPGFSKLPGVKANFVKQPLNKLREKFPPMSLSGRPTLSEAGVDLLNKLLTYDPNQRITAEDALNHAWFREVPLPKSKDFMPTFPALHAQDRRSGRLMKSPDPLEELLRKELQGKTGSRILFG